MALFEAFNSFQLTSFNFFIIDSLLLSSKLFLLRKSRISITPFLSLQIIAISQPACIDFKYLVIGLGVQGKKRVKIDRKNLVGTVDILNNSCP